MKDWTYYGGFPEPWHEYAARHSREVRCLFGFVAVDEELSAETFEDTATPDGPGTAAFRVRDIRKERGFEPATHEVVLDCIDAQHFMRFESHIDPCEINDKAQVSRRRGQLADLFGDEKKTGIVTVLFSNKNELEASYVANFQPSTWHRIILTLDTGIPVEYGNDISDAESRSMRLVYAAPVVPFEAERLFEIISLNHIPDIEAT